MDAQAGHILPVANLAPSVSLFQISFVKRVSSNGKQSIAECDG
jgi:hypothetical protein